MGVNCILVMGVGYAIIIGFKVTALFSNYFFSFLFVDLTFTTMSTFYHPLSTTVKDLLHIIIALYQIL
jgi:hypothetical protein